MLDVAFQMVTERLRRNILAVPGNVVPVSNLGEEFLPNPGGCPAIIWVPGRGPITGGRQAIDQQNPVNPRGIFQRNLNVAAYVFAADYKTTAALFRHFVAALHAELPGRWSPTDEAWGIGWPTTTNEPSAVWASGTLCILSFDVRFPLFDEANPEVTPTGMTLAGNFVDLELS